MKSFDNMFKVLGLNFLIINVKKDYITNNVEIMIKSLVIYIDHELSIYNILSF